MRLTDNEKRDAIKLLQEGKPLPDKYRFLLFQDDREVELVWNGKTQEVCNMVLPFQTIEHIDEPRSERISKDTQIDLFDTSGRQIRGWTNKLIWGDNKLILSSLKNGPMRQEIEKQGGLKLIYIDPPFDVGADFSTKIQVGEEEVTKNPSVIEEVAYRDTWGKGADSYIAMIYERLHLMHDLLAENGAIFVHCDWRMSPYLRAILNEIFGEKNFQNEIYWYYYNKLHGASKDCLPRATDTILYYIKNRDKEYSFNHLKEPRDKPVKKLKYHFIGGKIVNDKDEHGKTITYLSTERQIDNVWRIRCLQPADKQEWLGYGTQKPQDLIERILLLTSKEGDLVADFFCGSGTCLAAAEKFGRKWIGADLGRFAIHTSRKRLIQIQREIKNSGKDFRAFEILNLGKYEREHYVNVDVDIREKEKRQILESKEKQFVELILSAYKAEPVNSYNSFVGKKRDRLVAVGPISTPVSAKFIEIALKEAKEKNITKFDILGFDYEMGVDFAEISRKGVDVQFKIIPREVFDRRAVEKGHVKFYDVAYIEVKPIIKGRGNNKAVAVELCDFSVFYNQDSVEEAESALKEGSSKIVIENGQVIKVSKDKKTSLISKEVLTKKWTDWVDYWSVDFNLENKKEIVRVIDPKSGEEKEVWTGGYIFENEWQSFRTKRDRKLDLTSAEKEVSKGRRKIAVKVVDIFGNDTTRVIELNIS